MSEMTFNILAIGGVCVLVGLLRSGWASGPGELQIEPARVLDLHRSRKWPATEATVEEVEVMLVRSSPLNFARRLSRDTTHVTIGYDVNGIHFRSLLKVLSSLQDRYWTRLNKTMTLGEKLMIRYDPENPSVVFPVEKTWHGGQVWRLG